MISKSEIECPGCGLRMPHNPRESYNGYYHVSAECWGLFTEILDYEFSNPVQVWKVHQLTVDTYAIQHAGGIHPDKSVGVHLSGLHLALEQRIPPPEIAPMIQRLADRIETWPHFPAPDTPGSTTILDIALADCPAEHSRIVRDWARDVWDAWSFAHEPIALLLRDNL